MSLTKCVLGAREIELIGYRVSETKLSPTEDNAKKILEFRIPYTVKKTKQKKKLSWYSYFFIGAFSRNTRNELVHSLNLLKRGSILDLGMEIALKALRSFKMRSLNTPLLQQPDFEKPFVITCDSSKIAVSGILL